MIRLFDRNGDGEGDIVKHGIQGLGLRFALFDHRVHVTTVLVTGVHTDNRNGSGGKGARPRHGSCANFVQLVDYLPIESFRVKQMSVAKRPAGYTAIYDYLRKYQSLFAYDVVLEPVPSGIGYDFSGDKEVYQLFFEGCCDSFMAIHPSPYEPMDQSPVYYFDLSGGFDHSPYTPPLGNIKTVVKRKQPLVKAALVDVEKFSSTLARKDPYEVKLLPEIHGHTAEQWSALSPEEQAAAKQKYP